MYLPGWQQYNDTEMKLMKSAAGYSVSDYEDYISMS
jgi:hypothetical protein